MQDKCPVSSYESIRKMIRDDTGQEIEDLFEYFEPVPIGAGMDDLHPRRESR